MSYTSTQSADPRPKIHHRILDLLIPRFCFICGRPKPEQPLKFTCKWCREGIEFIDSNSCQRCGFPFFGKIETARTCPACRENPPDTDAGKALILHRGNGALLVQELKYYHGNFLVEEMVQFIRQRRDLEEFFAGTLLIPVPLHPRKLRERGYNQAELITQAIARCFDCRMETRVVKKIKDVRTQTFLSRKERKRNVKGTFRIINKEKLDPQLTYVIVDDVFTTGSTLSELSQTLRKAGVKNLRSFTLAHG